MTTTRSGAPGYPRKRARTRRQLLVAGMAVLAEHGPDGATVGEIARRAHMAPGTFYNHFASLDDMVAAVVDELARGVEIGRELLADVEHDPAARVAIGARQLLALVDDDPSTAHAFVSLIADVPAFRSRVRATVAGAVRDGIAAGRFAGRDPEVVTDALIGAVVQWMRTRLLDDLGRHDIVPHLRLVLEIAGLPNADVDQVAAHAIHVRLDARA